MCSECRDWLHCFAKCHAFTLAVLWNMSWSMPPLFGWPHCCSAGFEHIKIHVHSRMCMHLVQHIGRRLTDVHSVFLLRAAIHRQEKGCTIGCRVIDWEGRRLFAIGYCLGWFLIDGRMYRWCSSGCEMRRGSTRPQLATRQTPVGAGLCNSRLILTDRSARSHTGQQRTQLTQQIQLQH